MTTNSAKLREIIRHNIRYVRKNKGYTQQQFADEFEITRCSLGSYEEGRADTPLWLIINICLVFEIKLEIFVGKKL